MDLTKDEVLIVKLRDCFTAGYTLPQYCIDNNIKRPLFVAEKKFELLLWEIYVQFSYDKRMTAQFCYSDGEESNVHFPGHDAIIKKLTVKNFSAINLNTFDKIIFLMTNRIYFAKAIYLDALTYHFICKIYCEIPLLNFLQRYPKVKLFLTTYPARMDIYKDGTKFHNQLYGYGEFINNLRANKSGNIKTTLDKFGYTNEQILEISTVPNTKRNPDGSTVIIDDATKTLQNIKNGRRVTAYQPDHFQHRIYFVGHCIYYGVFAPYDKTIESYLQKILNENNLPYRVENESQPYDTRTQDTFYNLNNLNPNPGDIIFVVVQGLRTQNDVIPFADVNDAFAPPNDYREIFCTKAHINELGYKLMAEKYFDFLTKNNFFREICFNYPAPPNVSQIRYTTAIRARRHEIFHQRGIGSLQENSSSEKTSCRCIGHELQSVHSRTPIFSRIRGG